MKLPWRSATALFASLLAALEVLAFGSSATARDGRHDFDFNFGTWRTHIKYLRPVSDGSAVWAEMNGTVAVRKIWMGRASMEEIEADGANGHFEGLTLFLYNPQSHEWSQTFADSEDGVLNAPMIGAFENGRGELISQTADQGKIVLLRDAWSKIAANSHHFEESVSTDEGRSWHAHFIANLTREAPNVVQTPPPPDHDTVRVGGAHDFDFEIGTWRIHSTRSGAYSHIVQTVWGGRASLAQLREDSPAQRYAGLMLRTYDPKSQQWSIYWASSSTGTLDPALVGSFKNGRGEFFAQESLSGKTELVRLAYFDIRPHSFRTEQSYSSDGGHSWGQPQTQTFTRESGTAQRRP
jgi:hypothetical protein